MVIEGDIQDMTEIIMMIMMDIPMFFKSIFCNQWNIIKNIEIISASLFVVVNNLIFFDGLFGYETEKYVTDRYTEIDLFYNL